MRSTYVRVIGVTLLWAFLASPLIISTHFAQTKESNRAQENRLLESTSEKIRPGQRMEGANLENEDLHLSMLAGVRLKRAKLKSANLEMAMLVGADLQGADLEYANLKQAMLVGANLGKAKLINTNFEEANLLGASLEGARIEGASFKNTYVTQDQIDETCGRPRALPQGLKIPKPC